VHKQGNHRWNLKKIARIKGIRLQVEKLCIRIIAERANFEISIDIISLSLIPIVLYMGIFLNYLLVLIAISLHELSHIAVAGLLGKRIHSVKILSVGLNASIDEIGYGRWSSIAIFTAGPLCNILLYSGSSWLCSYYLLLSEGMRFFISTNLTLAIFNLLPVLPLDGGRILREILSMGFGMRQGTRFSKRVSFLFTVLLIFFGIVQIMNNYYNFSLILIGIYIIFRIRAEEMEAAIMNIKNVIYRRSRFMKKGIYAARDLAVIKSTLMSEVIKNMDFDRFHIIYVLDDQQKIYKVLTEQQVMDGLLKYDSELTFEEYIQRENIE
jgi:stage IV sporulation protein FB